MRSEWRLLPAWLQWLGSTELGDLPTSWIIISSRLLLLTNNRNCHVNSICPKPICCYCIPWYEVHKNRLVWVLNVGVVSPQTPKGCLVTRCTWLSHGWSPWSRRESMSGVHRSRDQLSASPPTAENKGQFVWQSGCPLRCVHARISCARDRPALSDLLAVYRLHFWWFHVSKSQCTFPSNYLKYRLYDEPLVPKAQLDCVSWVWAHEPVHIYEWEHNHEQKHALPQGTWTNYFCPSPLLKIQCTVFPISTVPSPSTHAFMWHIADATFLLRVGPVAQSV